MAYDPEQHGTRRVVGPGFHALVFAVVAEVPHGRVTTYGDVAAALGRRGVARHVGNAMGMCPTGIPWYRVVNAQGMVSLRADGNPSARQIKLLRGEGLEVDGSGRVRDFRRLRWTPPGRT